MFFTSTININFAKARCDLSKEPTRRCPHGWYSGCKLGMLEDSPRIDISGELHESVIRHLAIAALVAYPLSALGADQATDVKGKWIAKTHTILVGKGGHWPKGRGTWDQPALLEKDLAFDIRVRTAAASGA